MQRSEGERKNNSERKKITVAKMSELCDHCIEFDE